MLNNIPPILTPGDSSRASLMNSSSNNRKSRIQSSRKSLAASKSRQSELPKIADFGESDGDET